MNTKSRIASILDTKTLDSSVTGFPTFDLSSLESANDLEFDLPTNLRLGHLVEKIVSYSIQSSQHYKLLYENIQIKDDQKTIGEIDFIVEDIRNQQLTHVELAYKFYLYDPTISSKLNYNWIGPNRNDSLMEKLEKLRVKQFPLLNHARTASQLCNVDLKIVSQALCLLVSLFVPHHFKQTLPPSFQQAIKGYYVNLETFISLHSDDRLYHIPIKTAWGIDPQDNEDWHNYASIISQLEINMFEKQAPLCWQKQQGIYTAFFVIWW
ncbi:DUF1853 family protein [Flavobacterium algicola]|uniref:DUF1853 family protein n=1 Tax=Flavobacterium algicola TaxID=556529 RepID=UPI001EFEB68B|nr:DUF1853 family protein [Flavobacterium algicola]MCG9792999.1 DUF1853 family protein [Flavobacterium algicola]